MALKTIRIRESDGKVVDADREVHVYTRPGMGGPDQVKWIVDPPPGGAAAVFRVVFGSSFDPFAPGKTVDVPGNPGGSVPEAVQGLAANYKYSVVRVTTSEVTDDPNIIIRS